MPELQFPTSTAPGINPAESGGRMVNCIVDKAPEGSRSQFAWRRPPGLTTLLELFETEPRGALFVGSALYVVSGSTVYSILKSGAAYFASALSGSVGGDGAVIMARNMAAIPNILIQHSDGLSLIDISAGSVADFSDASLPATNSICWIDGYFIATSEIGDAYQSGINNTSFSTIDRQRAESSPDGLVRAIANGRDLLLMGGNSIEFYSNAGNETGFVFNRGPVLPLGLAGKLAVAGFEDGFTSVVAFVANDRTVRRLDGYTPTKISNPDLDLMLAMVSDPADIECSVHIVDGHPYVVITTPDWTWAYDLSTGSWHEKLSYGATRWRARFGVYAFGQWLTFDRDSGKVFAVDGRNRTEDGDPLIWRLISTQHHRFPGRFKVPRASFDFVTGVGIAAGIDPIQTDPVVRISWSDDGGRTWSNSLVRALGPQGETTSIDLWNCGITKRSGRMWQLEVADPVEVAFLGGAMEAQELAA